MIVVIFSLPPMKPCESLEIREHWILLGLDGLKANFEVSSCVAVGLGVSLTHQCTFHLVVELLWQIKGSEEGRKKEK